MSNSQIGPVALTERIEILDVLRGLAVCGILIGNMQWFSGYGFMPPSLEHQTALVDQVTRFLVHFFVEGKFYSIFSFLFGFGFALQIARAEERGDTKASLFKRRLFWLLVIGALHALLLWSGDILSVYALMGFILILFRKKPDRSLLKWAFALVLVPIVTYALMYALFLAFAPPDVASMVAAGQNEMWNQAVNTVPHSNYFQIISGFNLQGLAGRWAGLIFQMRLPKILAMFLLGFYAYRQGFFHDVASHRPFIQRVLVYGLTLGIICNAIFAAFARSEADLPPSLSGLIGVVMYAFGVPALALGLIALVATLWQGGMARRVLAVFAPVGQMALTNYLMQSLICVLIFYGYGLGLFGSVRASYTIAIAVAIFLFQIVFSTLWLTYFSYGPMEWIWRQLTYQKRLPLTR